MRFLPLLLLFVACGGAVDPPPPGDCSDTWSSYASGFFAGECRSCHQHASQFGTQASVQASLSSLQVEINEGRMPKGGGLTVNERDRILAWMACGAP